MRSSGHYLQNTKIFYSIVKDTCGRYESREPIAVISLFMKTGAMYLLTANWMSPIWTELERLEVVQKELVRQPGLYAGQRLKGGC
jgi:hypothetical protein